jgi:hypothetical protein
LSSQNSFSPSRRAGVVLTGVGATFTFFAIRFAGSASIFAVSLRGDVTRDAGPV